MLLLLHPSAPQLVERQQGTGMTKVAHSVQHCVHTWCAGDTLRDWQDNLKGGLPVLCSSVTLHRAILHQWPAAELEEARWVQVGPEECHGKEATTAGASGVATEQSHSLSLGCSYAQAHHTL